MTHEVFISYASEEAAAAAQVCSALEESGIACWMAPRDVKPGSEYAEQLVEAIRGARALVLLFSKAATASEHIRRELDCAVSARVAVLSVRLEELEPSGALHYYLAGRQWCDAFPAPLEPHLKQVQVAVADLLASKEAAPPAVRAARRRRARVLLAAAAILAAAAVAALVVWALMPSRTPVNAGASQSHPIVLTAAQIANRYGDSIVDISAKVRVADKNHRIVWKNVHESGVVVSKDGLIYTSDPPLGRWPVLIDPEVVTVGVYSNGSYRTVPGYKIVIERASHSATMIKVDPRHLHLEPMPQGDSESVRKGDRVVCLSRFGGTLGQSTGVVVSTSSGSDTFAGNKYHVLQMVTSSPSKSPTGGALVDATGHLIGVMGPAYTNVTGAAGPAAGLTGPGAATAVNWYRNFIPNTALQVQQNAQPVTLGIDYLLDLTPQVTRTKLARSFGLGGQRGVLIEGVVPDGPAAKAGLRGARQLVQYNGTWVQADGTWVGVGGDILLALNRQPTYNRGDVVGFLRHATPGSVVSVRVLRFRTSALRQAPEGLALRSQSRLLRHYWRPVTVKVTLGPAKPVYWIW